MVQHIPLFPSHAARARTRVVGGAGLSGGRRTPRRLFVLLGLLGLWLGVAAAEGRLTVMTWNVENYVDEDRIVEGGYRPDYPKPEAAKAALRTAIREAGPDVLALQEMGPGPYLEELQRDLATEGTDYPHRALLEGPDPKRHLAVLSRRPLRRIERHPKVWHHGTGAPQTVCRGVLVVTVAAAGGGEDVTLFLVHLKSRHTGDPADPGSAAQRAGEAEAVRDLVLRRFPRPEEAAFLVLGDCNDTPRSRPLRALLRRGDTQITTLRPAPDAGGDGWTHCYRREDSFSRVDYILVSPGLVPAVERMWVHDSPAVRAASDHRPVLVRLGPPAAAAR